MRKTVITDKEISDLQKVLTVFKDAYKHSLPDERVSIDTNDLTNGQWLMLRALFGVGGSEAGILRGTSKFEGANALSMYKLKCPLWYQQESGNLTKLEMRALANIIENSQNDGMDEERQRMFDLGHIMEEYIKSSFEEHFEEDYKAFLEEQFGKKIEKIQVYKDSNLFLCTEAPMFADFDYLIDIHFTDQTGQMGIFECKTVKPWLVEDKFGLPKTGTFAPDSYIDQCNHYMYVNQHATFAIIAYDGGSYGKSGIRFVPKNQDIIDDIVRRSKDFWENHVMPQIEPVVEKKNVLPELAGKPISKGETTLGRVAGRKCAEVLRLTAKKATLDKESRDLGKEIDVLKSELAQSMETEAALTTFDGTTYRIYQKDKISTRFDKKKLLKEKPELEHTIGEYTISSVTRSVDVLALD